MPLARIGATTLFFVHIPKTGGTSVEAYLRAKGALALHGQGADWARVPLQHLHRAAYAEIVPPGAYDHGFAIIRDPVERLLSEFRMRVEPLGARWRPFGRLRARGRPVYGVRVDRRLEALDLDSWVDRVLAAAARDPWTRSNHFRPQADFVDPAHRLFRFENGFNAVFRWIDAATGTSPAPGAFHERRSATMDLALGPATARAVRDFYAADYALIDRLTRHPVDKSHINTLSDPEQRLDS